MEHVNNSTQTHIGPLFWRSRVVNMEQLVIESCKDVIHIVGENGIGKSTLLSAALEWLLEHNISANFVHQDYRNSWFWWRSVRQNLELAWQLSGHTDSFMNSPLYQRESSWLKPILERPLEQINFDTQAGQETSGLSGGQLQRIVLLRELIFEPKYLLLDEALSALDPQVLNITIEWLLHIQKEYKFVIISISHSKRIQKLMPGDVLTVTRENAYLKISSSKT